MNSSFSNHPVSINSAVRRTSLLISLFCPMCVSLCLYWLKNGLTSGYHASQALGDMKGVVLISPPLP